jgi:hypothetical protein
MPSTVIQRFDYSAKEEALDVTFSTGKRYRYLRVPQKVYRGMREAFSKGVYFNRHIKDRFAFEKLE